MEKIILGARVRDTPYFSWRDSIYSKWQPIITTNTTDIQVIEHSKDHGLFFIKGYLNKDMCSHILSSINQSCTTDPSRSIDKKIGSYQPWYQYDPSRFIAGCLPHDDNSISYTDQMTSLTDFEVFGNIHPSKWLSLNTLCKHESPYVSKGSHILRQLQLDIPKLLNSIYLSHTFKCAFLQFQRMERGVRIMPHIDSDIPQVDLIVTACISGSNIIRIGSVDVLVQEGDIYALSGYARHCVKHEVLSSPQDRLTVTYRYVSVSDNEYRKYLQTKLPTVPM